MFNNGTGFVLFNDEIFDDESQNTLIWGLTQAITSFAKISLKSEGKLELIAGKYTVENFIVVNDKNSALYLTPKEGSKFEDLVNIFLPVICQDGNVFQLLFLLIIKVHCPLYSIDILTQALNDLESEFIYLIIHSQYPGYHLLSFSDPGYFPLPSPV